MSDVSEQAALESAWAEYLAEHGYSMYPVQPDTGADFSAGFDAGTKAMRAERDAALAVIEQVRQLYDARCDATVIFSTDGEEMFLAAIREAIDQSPASALAKVKADAWEEGAIAQAVYHNGVNAGYYGKPPTNPYRAEADRIEGT